MNNEISKGQVFNYINTIEQRARNVEALERKIEEKERKIKELEMYLNEAGYTQAWRFIEDGQTYVYEWVYGDIEYKKLNELHKIYEEDKDGKIKKYTLEEYLKRKDIKHYLNM